MGGSAFTTELKMVRLIPQFKLQKIKVSTPRPSNGICNHYDIIYRWQIQQKASRFSRYKTIAKFDGYEPAVNFFNTLIKQYGLWINSHKN